MISIAYFGTPEFSTSFLQALHQHPEFKITAVICQPDRPQGRKKIITTPPTKKYALEHGIPIHQPTNLKKEKLTLNADIFVVVAYGNILPKNILNQPTHGTINVHPSLLPKYRGPSPIQSAIAAQETETGVSIMLLDEKMDHGPILAQQKIELSSDETTSSLTKKVVDIGAPLLVQSIEEFVDGTRKPQPQNHHQATFCKLLSRQDGILSWNESAESIDAKIRAYTPWPGTTGTILDHDVKIKRAALTNEALPIGKVCMKNGNLLIGTSSTALSLLSVQPPGKSPMTGQEFFNGFLK